MGERLISVHLLLPLNSLAQSLHKLVNMAETGRTNDDLVLPGDIIATAEEYVPGRNTAEDGGRIISLVYGNLKKDEENLTVSVSPVKKRKTIKNGDTVYGMVVRLDQRKASVKIGATYDRESGVIQFNAEGYLNLPQQYDRNSSAPIRIGDIVRAKVVRTGDRGAELSINGKHLGVLKTLCPKCRLPMVRRNSSLYCENCEKSEIRKVADDYGVIEISGEIE